MVRKGKKLRRGFTTGTSAAAGTKAAAEAAFNSILKRPYKKPKKVSVTLPSGKTIDIPVKSVKVEDDSAYAVIIKDAGDDPDVTNGAEFISTIKVKKINCGRANVKIKGGVGVGKVTRPGLKIPPGNPAINPVPLKMIKAALIEAAKEAGVTPSVEVTISVPKGEELAEKTMNPRLGVIGGISILGTSGIVEPMSLIAYTHSISAGVDVALASGLTEVVFSTGRSSEKVVEKAFGLPEYAYVLTGDHMGYALKDTLKRTGLKKVMIAGQFGKFSKLAAGHFETHCSDSSVEFEFLAGLCKKNGAGDKVIKKVLSANTARQVFFLLKEEGLAKVLKEVCRKVKENSQKMARKGVEVKTILVGYDEEITSAS